MTISYQSRRTAVVIQAVVILICLLYEATAFIARQVRPSPVRESSCSVASNNVDHNRYYQDDSDDYSRCLSPKEERQNVLREGKDYDLTDQRPLSWKRTIWKPIQRLLSPTTSAIQQQPGNLILIKCGESEWKKNFTFTGWCDPDITQKGHQECEHAARLLLESGYYPDIVYTSRLKRSIHSAWTILREIDSNYLPVFKSWRLNERMYGALQGLSKDETARTFGSNVVQAWRRTFKARPPPISMNDPYYPGNDRRYSDLLKEQIPTTESLQDCMERTRPLWDYKISKELRNGNNLMVVAHFHTLRGLVKIIDGLEDDDISNFMIPSGIPFVYKFDRNMKPVRTQEEEKEADGTEAVAEKSNNANHHVSGYFLEKPGLLEKALKRQGEWKRNVPGLNEEEEGNRKAKKRMSSLEESLLKLKDEKQMELWAAEEKETSEMDGDMDFSTAFDEEFEEDTTRVEKTTKKEKNITDFVIESNKGSPEWQSSATILSEETDMAQINVDTQKDPVVVFIRHGRTPHNLLALFTGWEDPPLAPDGVEDAKRAGRLLRKHGFHFDVVYSSWLSRAIDTALYVLDELDEMWLPVIKSWRLNERHYGALTGKSKKMIGNMYGQDKLKTWRRSFDVPPPPSSSFSFEYPGNDYRRTKYVKDLRISLRQTMFRSLEAGRLEIHRNFPRTESLKSCMARSIPFYTQKIVPEAVAKGKRVLITSHENAIRGILMHLCEIPPEHMNELHLPNGVPLVYNVKRKCITLLDDGSGEDLMAKYDFGSAAQYLFKPCKLTDEDFLF